MTVQEVPADRSEIGKTPHCGYYERDVPPPDPYLTETGPGTPMGEYLRRYWHPVCLSEELTDLPKAIRILGEDLVAFRDKSGDVGVLHRHCSHRGTSLEYGIISERGIRCCYHGWLFDVDGTILETPGEPPDSKLKDGIFHGAYPAQEYEGLVHAYMGPPDLKPHFPKYDLFEVSGAKFAPFSFALENNWLQTFENHMDPFHSVFLHQRIMQHFGDHFGALPRVIWELTGNGKGVRNAASRRLDDDTVWIRIVHVLMPNCGFLGSTFDLPEECYYLRTFHLRRAVPVDDENCTMFGWRIHGEGFPGGDPKRNGPGSIDMDGQVKREDYEETQRTPDDWQAQGSQWGGVARHQIEHLGSTDIGIAQTRRLLKNILDGKLPEAWPKPASEEPDGPETQNVYSFDSILRVPRHPDREKDRQRLAELAEEMTEIVIDTADRLKGRERQDHVVSRFKEIETKYQALGTS